MKKAQTEIFGLLIIVILIAAGILFAISVMLQPDDKHTEKDKFYSAQLSQNFVLAMLKTTVNSCKGKTMEDLLVDCQNNEYKCNTTQYSSSCSYFRNVTREMFNETLENWNWNFYFEAQYKYRGSPDTLDSLSHNNCTKSLGLPYKGKKYSTLSQPGYVAIPMHPGTINVNLYFCME